MSHMEIPRPRVIKAPDFAKGLTDFKSAMSGATGGDAFDPVGAIIDGASAGNSLLNFIRVIAYWLARGLMLPFETIFRRRIGERYFSAPVIAVFAAVAFTVSARENVSLFIPAVIIMTLAYGLSRHTKTRKDAQRQGDYWHSYSEGESRLHIQTLQDKWDESCGPYATVDVAKLILEPIAPLVLAGICFLPELSKYSLAQCAYLLPKANLTLYFFSTALAMVAYQFFCAGIRKEQLLDALDAQVMIQIRAKAQEPGQKSGRINNYKGAAYVSSSTRQWAKAKSEPLQTSTGEVETAEVVSTIAEKPQSPDQAIRSPEPLGMPTETKAEFVAPVIEPPLTTAQKKTT